MILVTVWFCLSFAHLCLGSKSSYKMLWQVVHHAWNPVPSGWCQVSASGLSEVNSYSGANTNQYNTPEWLLREVSDCGIQSRKSVGGSECWESFQCPLLLGEGRGSINNRTSDFAVRVTLCHSDDKGTGEQTHRSCLNLSREPHAILFFLSSSEDSE